jgi:hypothetical protein
MTEKALCSLPGPPLSNDTALTVLLGNGVVVGLGVPEAELARNARFDMAWVRVGRCDLSQIPSSLYYIGCVGVSRAN